MKYKEEIQVITTVNKFLRFHTNPPNQHYTNYHEIGNHTRRYIIRIYGHCTFFTVWSHELRPPRQQLETNFETSQFQKYIVNHFLRHIKIRNCDVCVTKSSWLMFWHHLGWPKSKPAVKKFWTMQTYGDGRSFHNKQCSVPSKSQCRWL